MAIQIEESPKRVFIVVDSNDNEIEVSDPNPQLTPREVAKHLSGLYPNVLNSNIKGPEVQKDGSFKFTITSASGDFG